MGIIETVISKLCNIKTDLVISLTSLVISLIALIYTANTFYLKKGNKFRSSYGISTTEDGTTYVTSITIENQKDKPLVIHNIFLKVGYNYYFNIESFEDKPLVIKPFEVYQKKYDEILFYSNGLIRYNNSKLFKNGFKSKLQNIYLETSEQWKNSTRLSVFRNYCIGVFDPIRVYYNKKSYGYRALYLIECKFHDGYESIRKIEKYEIEMHHDKRFNRNLGIKYSKYCFKSKEYLQSFIDSQIEKGGGVYEDFSLISVKVIDRHEYINKILGEDYKYKKELKGTNWFGFYIICPIGTRIIKVKTWFINLKIILRNKLKK